MVRMPLLGVRKINEVGLETLQQRREFLRRPSDIVSHEPVRQAQKEPPGDSENPRRFFGFPFPRQPGLVSRQMFQSQFTRGQIHHRDRVAPPGVQAQRPAAPDRLIVRMRRNGQDLNAFISRR